MHIMEYLFALESAPPYPGLALPGGRAALDQAL